MNKLEIEIVQKQREICNRYVAEFSAVSLDKFIGIALQSFDELKLPINGLRHPVQSEFSENWYIWAGEYSEERDFFQPVHIRHLLEICPKAMNYLGLPPGWRFLFDNTYEDVWYDENLLRI